jgi:predicted nucleic acid-binding protein
LNEPDSNAAQLVMAHHLLAPPLLLYECANALWRRSAERPATGSGACRAGLMEVKLAWLAPPIGLVLALAIAIDQPVHDCAYLAIAEAEGARSLRRTSGLSTRRDRAVG